MRPRRRAGGVTFFNSDPETTSGVLRAVEAALLVPPEQCVWGALELSPPPRALADRAREVFAGDPPALAQPGAAAAGAAELRGGGGGEVGAAEGAAGTARWRYAREGGRGCRMWNARRMGRAARVPMARRSGYCGCGSKVMSLWAQPGRRHATWPTCPAAARRRPPSGAACAPHCTALCSHSTRFATTARPNDRCSGCVGCSY
jgi:hypothetical protein